SANAESPQVISLHSRQEHCRVVAGRTWVGQAWVVSGGRDLGDTESPAVAATDRVGRVRQGVRAWTGQLVDLGGRNNLLYYRDLKRGTLDLALAAPSWTSALLVW